MTKLIHDIQGVRDAIAQARSQGKTIGLVPTMGALHAGHGRLIETAHAECGYVAVSVFVNPIQFNQQADFDRYPRTLDADLRFCEERGASLVFAPDASEMYPHPPRTFVDVEQLTDGLCGKFRPGHFRGVATVVSKLFHIVQPDRAYFGEKDAQQLAVIRRMARDQDFPVAVVGVPIVREESGLALSSRNQHLTPAERAIAPALYQSLQAAAEMVSRGVSDPEEVRNAALAIFSRHPEFRVEYFEIVDPENVQPVGTITGPVLIAVAAWLGATRLIDNIQAKP